MGCSEMVVVAGEQTKEGREGGRKASSPSGCLSPFLRSAHTGFFFFFSRNHKHMLNTYLAARIQHKGEQFVKGKRKKATSSFVTPRAWTLERKIRIFHQRASFKKEEK